MIVPQTLIVCPCVIETVVETLVQYIDWLAPAWPELPPPNGTFAWCCTKDLELHLQVPALSF